MERGRERNLISYLAIVLQRRQGVHYKLEEVVENMSILHHFVLQHNQVHQNVTDCRHCIFGVHHLELGVVDNIKWLSHVSVILSFGLRKGGSERETETVECYLLV